jgi:hypothetical protein
MAGHWILRFVWGLFSYTLSLRYPTDKNMGGSSLVNALPTRFHTSCWSVCL